MNAGVNNKYQVQTKQADGSWQSEVGGRSLRQAVGIAETLRSEWGLQARVLRVSAEVIFVTAV